MNIDERDFFENSDNWIFERVLVLAARFPDPEITFINTKNDTVLPRSLAVSYAWYLALVAKKTHLAERIQTEFSPTKKAAVIGHQIVFKHMRQELHIAVTGVFKHCSFVQIRQWVPEVWRKVATPENLPLFTVDVLLAIQDEPLLAALFTNLPMLWLPTTAAVIPASQNISETVAYRVAARLHRLLIQHQQ